MDGVEPFIMGVDDGDDMRQIELGSQDQRFDVVDVGGLVGWMGVLCINSVTSGEIEIGENGRWQSQGMLAEGLFGGLNSMV